MAKLKDVTKKPAVAVAGKNKTNVTQENKAAAVAKPTAKMVNKPKPMKNGFGKGFAGKGKPKLPAIPSPADADSDEDDEQEDDDDEEDIDDEDIDDEEDDGDEESDDEEEDEEENEAGEDDKGEDKLKAKAKAGGGKDEIGDIMLPGGQDDDDDDDEEDEEDDDDDDEDDEEASGDNSKSSSDKIDSQKEGDEEEEDSDEEEDDEDDDDEEDEEEDDDEEGMSDDSEGDSDETSENKLKSSGNKRAASASASEDAVPTKKVKQIISQIVLNFKGDAAFGGLNSAKKFFSDRGVEWSNVRLSDNKVEADVTKVTASATRPPGAAGSGFPTSSKTLKVTNISEGVSQETLKGVFPTCVDIRLPREWKGFGFIEFPDDGEAGKVLKSKQGVECEGSSLHLEYDVKKQFQGRGNESFQNRGGRQSSGPTKTIFVGNLPSSADTDALYKLFPTASDVRLIEKERGSIGFIEYSIVESAKEAYEAAGTPEIGGSRLKMDYAQEVRGRHSMTVTRHTGAT